MNLGGPVGLSNVVKNSFVGAGQLDHLAYGNTQEHIPRPYSHISAFVLRTLRLWNGGESRSRFVCVSIVPFFFIIYFTSGLFLVFVLFFCVGFETGLTM